MLLLLPLTDPRSTDGVLIMRCRTWLLLVALAFGGLFTHHCPAAGPWLYFVVCQKNGASCFATTYAQHQQNITLAQQNGAY